MATEREYLHAIHDIAKDLLRTLTRGSHYIEYDNTFLFCLFVNISAVSSLNPNFYFLVSSLCLVCGNEWEIVKGINYKFFYPTTA